MAINKSLICLETSTLAGLISRWTCDPKIMQMCKPGLRFACDLLLMSKLVECLIYVDIMQKFVQTAHLIGSPKWNKVEEQIFRRHCTWIGACRFKLDWTCSLFIPWSIFASLRNSRSCSSSLKVSLRRPSPRWLSQQKLDQRSHDLLPPPCLATGSSRIVVNHARPEICWN